MKDMVLKNMIIRKVYLLAGVIMAANMFVGNEVRAMEGNKKLDTKPEENKEEPKIEKKIEEKNTNNIQNIKEKEGEKRGQPIIKGTKTYTDVYITGHIPGLKECKYKDINALKFRTEDNKEEEQKKSIRMLKTLRWCCFSAKPIVSLLWSFANSIYHFEKIIN